MVDQYPNKGKTLSPEGQHRKKEKNISQFTFVPPLVTDVNQSLPMWTGTSGSDPKASSKIQLDYMVIPVLSLDVHFNPAQQLAAILVVSKFG